MHSCRSGIVGKTSLINAFLEKGVKHGIASLWGVSEEYPDKVSDLFYQKYCAYKSTDNVQRTLWETQVDLCQQYTATVWAVYEYFSPKYTKSYSPNLLNSNEAKIEYYFENNILKAKIYMSQGISIDVDLPISASASLFYTYERYLDLIILSIKNQITSGFYEPYEVFWQKIDIELVTNNINTVYISLPDEITEIRHEPKFPTFTVLKDKNDKYLIEKYNIIMLH